ncbi:MAG: hypothetical protein NVS9B1_14760 [Candidatus Dormibacteraceae bacterium]
MPDSRLSRITVEGDFEAVQRWFEQAGMSDGLPLVPPTEERVTAMLAAAGGREGDPVGVLPPRNWQATLGNLAANAVMAGCAPAHFPVVLAALRAMLHPDFDLGAVQATTHPAAPLVIVHGPIAKRLGMNGGAGVLGPGNRANATIGRAIRLVLLNVGGARPGEGDTATQGSPAKFSYCMTENLDQSPWPAFHTTRGLAADTDAVTVYAGEAPHNVNDHESDDPVRNLNIVADVMSGLGQNSWYLSQDGYNDVVVVLGPEHARLASSRGMTRADVQQHLFNRARRTVAELRGGGMWVMRDWLPWMEALAGDPHATMAPVRRAEDILVLVAGGPGKHSCVIPGYGASRSVTVPLGPS